MRGLWFSLITALSVGTATGQELVLINDLVDRGYKIIAASYQNNIDREAIYFEKGGEYWICLVAYQIEDYGTTRAPYTGGGACFPLLGEREK